MTSSPHEQLSALSGGVYKAVAMISVHDISAALDWFQSIGFTVINTLADDDVLNFGMVKFGNAEVMMNLDCESRGGASLWFYTEQIDELYAGFEKRQTESGLPAVEFAEPINNTFYKARQFGIRGPDGHMLYFIQSLGPQTEQLR